MHYGRQEGRRLEFKESLANYRSILRTVTAFLNDVGGLIVIGIKDGSGEVVGVAPADLDRYLQEIPQSIHAAVYPYCNPIIRTRTFAPSTSAAVLTNTIVPHTAAGTTVPDIAELTDPGELFTVVEIEVLPGDRKPYFIKSEGLPQGVYYRFGSHTKRAPLELVEDLQRQQRGKSFDAEAIAGISVEALDQSILKNFYRGQLPSQTALRADKITALDPPSNQDSVSVAGAIFFHPRPASALSAAEIMYSEFKGSSTDEIIRTIDISDPLPISVERILSLMTPQLQSRTARKGPYLVGDQFEIPPLAIREALLNALVHRNYTIEAPIKVALFQDRLEIFSPGSFPGPIAEEDLQSGLSYYRNPALAQLARKAGLVERRGLGLALIISSCRKNGNPPPEIIDGSNYVKVILYRKLVDQSQKDLSAGLSPELTGELAPLEKYRLNNEPISTLIAARELGVTPNTARQRVAVLVKQGRLKRQGSGRATKYYWV